MLIDILLLVVFVGLYAGTSLIVYATGGFWPYPSVQGGLSPHKALLLYGAPFGTDRCCPLAHSRSLYCSF